MVETEVPQIGASLEFSIDGRREALDPNIIKAQLLDVFVVSVILDSATNFVSDRSHSRNFMEFEFIL